MKTQGWRLDRAPPEETAKLQRLQKHMGKQLWGWTWPLKFMLRKNLLFGPVLEMKLAHKINMSCNGVCMLHLFHGLKEKY